MSLLLQTCNCSNCQSEKVIFNDETGLYATNGTGYGAPNLAIADITLATIDAIYPNGTVAQSFDVTADVILDATGFFTKEFSPSDFGLTAFEDGWGKFTYNVAGTVLGLPVSYSSVKEFFYACGLKCCVAKQAAKAALEDEACCDDCSQKKLYAKMKNAYEIMQDALGKCGNKAAANKQWERLKLLCAGKDCGCGGH